MGRSPRSCLVLGRHWNKVGLSWSVSRRAVVPRRHESPHVQIFLGLFDLLWIIELLLPAIAERLAQLSPNICACAFLASCRPISRAPKRSRRRLDDVLARVANHVACLYAVLCDLHVQIGIVPGEEGRPDKQGAVGPGKKAPDEQTSAAQTPMRYIALRCVYMRRTA